MSLTLTKVTLTMQSNCARNIWNKILTPNLPIGASKSKSVVLVSDSLRPLTIDGNLASNTSLPCTKAYAYATAQRRGAVKTQKAQSTNF